MKSQDSATSRSHNEKDEAPGEFPEIDHIGFYTLGIYVALSMPLILSAARGLSYVFTTGAVDYRCLIPECENPAETTLYPSWLANAVPYTDSRPETCTRFIVQNLTNSCSTTVFANVTQNCNTWIYDPEESTILNEWDLTCENNLWKLTLPGTMNNVGQFFGLMVSGYLSDKYGRRKLLAIGTTISSLLGLTKSFSINYEMFVGLEFLDAIAGSGVYSAAFVLGMEFVGPKRRIQASTITTCLYVVWMIFLGVFAMSLRSWRHLLRVFYAPGLFAIFLPCLVPEPVRWLQTKGRLEEAEAMLRKIAAKNKVPVSEKSILMIRNSRIATQDQNGTSSAPSTSPLKEVIHNRSLILRIFFCTLCWMANTFVYWGLSLRSVAVPGDKYVNFILVASVEIPALFASWILADYVGRKPTAIIAYLSSGVLCIATIFVPPDWGYMPIIVFVAGKLCITIAYNLVFTFTTEMFPTQLRHFLLTFCSTIGRVGSMIAPQTPLLAHYMPQLPSLLFGIVAISAGLLSLNFPETVGTKLPDTVSEAERIGHVQNENQRHELLEQIHNQDDVHTVT